MENKILISTLGSILLSTNIYGSSIKKLDNITVTAQKIEENENEVPISMEVINEFEISDKNIKTIDDLAGITPNFFIFNVGDMGWSAPVMRGLSADPSSVSSTVSLYIDGIPTFSSVAYDAVLKNIERIEILKGPQGTLYGKNAQAGVINVITKQATNEIESNIDLEFGSDNKQEYTFNTSGAIIKDKLYANILGNFYKKDGFMRNTYLNKDHNYREHKYGKLNLKYFSNDNLSFNLNSSYFKRDDGSQSINTYPNVGNNREIKSDIQPHIKSSTFANSFKINYDLEDYDFESITTYKEDKEDRFCEKDYSIYKYYHIKVDEPFKTISQEFKLSKIQENYKWLFGIYGDKFKKTGGYKVDSVDPSYAGTFNSIMDDYSFGIFSHLDYSLNNTSAILLGLRYDRDNKEFKNDSISLENSYNELSPKFTYKSYINKDAMYYLTVSKGYKSGGYYKYAPSNDKLFYDKETLWNYELGLKSSFLDNKLNLNSSIYYMDISNMQVYSNINNFNGYISNAAEASSKGFEIDLSYELTSNLQVNGSYGYNKTTFDKFSDTKGDYSNKYNLFSPKYTYALGLKYRDNQGIYASINMKAYGDMYLDKANAFKEDAYEIVDAKVGYESEDYDIYLYGKNIFDKVYDYEGYFDEQYLSKPRELGIQLSYRF